MAGRTLLGWATALLGGLGLLAGVIALVDPTNPELWIWIGVVALILALREAYARYLRDELHALDPATDAPEDGTV